jgi:hypothetical protein
MDGDGAEVHERDREVVGSSNRDRQAAVGNRARERDRAAHRSADGSSRCGADIDAAVLARCVWIRA